MDAGAERWTRQPHSLGGPERASNQTPDQSSGRPEAGTSCGRLRAKCRKRSTKMSSTMHLLSPSAWRHVGALVAVLSSSLRYAFLWRSMRVLPLCLMLTGRDLPDELGLKGLQEGVDSEGFLMIVTVFSTVFLRLFICLFFILAYLALVFLFVLRDGSRASVCGYDISASCARMLFPDVKRFRFAEVFSLLTPDASVAWKCCSCQVSLVLDTPFASAKRAVRHVVPSRGTKFHWYTRALHFSCPFLEWTQSEEQGRRGTVCSAENSSTCSVQVEFQNVLLRLWCPWQLRPWTASALS